MTTSRPTLWADAPARIPSWPSFEILESKLRPHVHRRAMVPRAALLDRLEVSGSVPVVAIVAPPGYGKTTLLAQWAQRDPRPFAWLSIDQHDNDPVVLLTCVAVALDQVEPIDPAVFHALASPGTSITDSVIPRLGAILAAKALPVVVVLDDAQLLRDQQCLDAVAVLAESLPPGSQLAIASRGEPRLPLARLRAEGRVVELGAADLAMDRQEAGSLLRDAGVDCAHVDVAGLARRTEGWPVALYLAALSLQAGGTGAGAAAAPVGEDRFLVEYLQSVLLSRLPPKVVSFLTRTAVLERMSGPLCDAVLATSGSAELLASLERSNLLLIPLDRRRRWYRYHRLFRELLRAELGRREPELVGGLHARAAAWYAANGLAELAIDHAQATGDADQVARLVTSIALSACAGGRATTVQRWLDWFDDHGLLERYPAVAVVGAWVHAFVGHPAAAERWAGAAERGSFEKTPDGSASIGGWLAVLRAMRCRDGVAQMRTDAKLALTLVPVGSPWRAAALLLLGVSQLLAGDPDGADGILADAVEAGEDTGTDSATVALAERSILAIGRGQWSQAELLAERARSLVYQARLEEYVTTVLLYAATARAAIHRGDVPRAREDLARAQRLRPQLTDALPVYAVQARLELVRAYIALTDVAGARTVLREADDLLLRMPGLGILQGQADELRAQLDLMRADVIGASALTGAELRLLQLLVTHHSFRGIGERLSLSRHTVKSQAMSIYRKFGVSSRSEAVQRAHDLRLLAE